MDDGSRIPEDVEHFLRGARSRDVQLCVDALNEKPHLINAQEAGGYGALHFAAFNGDLPMIEMLLSNKPNLDLENYDNNTPLVMAVKGHQLQAIRALVKAGATVDKQSPTGSTAIHHAASMGHLDVVRLLVELGAKVTFPPSEAGSLMHWACHSGDTGIVGAMLYEFHIPVDTLDKHGGTPLFTALYMKAAPVVEFLLEHGADVNVTIPDDGSTPLHIAVEHSNAECVKLVCECGGSASTKNKEGQTPADLAQKGSDRAIMREIGKSQANPENREEQAARFKAQGNKVFAAGENVKAAKFYTLAIHLDNKNHVYFSNRAACYFNQANYASAYWDAYRCVTLAPQWPKGFLRKATTELSMGKYDDAIATAEQGLKLDASNKDLSNVREEARRRRLQ